MDSNTEVVYLNQNINPEEFTLLVASQKVRELKTLKGYDLVNIEIEKFEPESVLVKYKNIHYTVPSASQRPYRYILFKEA